MIKNIATLMMTMMLSATAAAGDVVTTNDEYMAIKSKECAAMYPKDPVGYSACLKGEQADKEQK